MHFDKTMNKLRKPFLEWFGYNRRERRSAIVLLIICLIILSARFITPDRDEIPALTPLTTAMTAVESEPVVSSPARYTGAKRQVSREVLNIELNSCDSAVLDRLPGIGPVLSARIVKFRNLLGGYADTRQLLEVYGLPEETYARISAMVRVDTTLITRIKVNTFDYRDLVKHPYITPANASAILSFRKKIGRIPDWQTMFNNNLISGERAEILRYYLAYD
jgi:DNA uptake protein ComE-like DNA-binding protein